MSAKPYRRAHRPCHYCGHRTRHLSEACIYHRDLLALDPGSHRVLASVPMPTAPVVEDTSAPEGKAV